VKQPSKSVGEETASLDPGSLQNSDETGNLVDVLDTQVRFFGLSELLIYMRH